MSKDCKLTAVEGPWRCSKETALNNCLFRIIDQNRSQSSTHQKKKVQGVFPALASFGLRWSGRQDSNLRPHEPHSCALAKLSYAPT